MVSETMSVQAVPKAEFDPSTLTGSFAVMNGSGFAAPLKIWKLWNGSTTVPIEISFDGVNAHDYIPPLGTLIVDFQAGHADSPSYGSGTWNVRQYQQIWGRTAANPTYLQMIGYY